MREEAGGGPVVSDLEESGQVSDSRSRRGAGEGQGADSLKERGDGIITSISQSRTANMQMTKGEEEIKAGKERETKEKGTKEKKRW